MYDKINMTLFADDMQGVDPLKLTKHLYNAEQRLKETGELTANGVVGGMKAYITPDYINLIGSFPKVLYRSNCYTLDRSSTKEAITKLSDLLHVDVSTAKVREIEFGTVFPMRYPVADYFPLLGEAANLKRCAMVEKETLMYWQKTRARELIFYDKAAETEWKGKDIPTDFQDCNLLRYEIRYRSGQGKPIAKRLGVDKLEASTLYDRGFYRKMLGKYWEEYDNIKKLDNTVMDKMASIRTAKDVVNMVCAYCVRPQDKQVINDILEQSKAYVGKQNYLRAKKEINKLMNSGGSMEDRAKIEELTQAVRTVSVNG